MSLRTEKVASLIKEEVGMYFTREYRDLAHGFITVTEVHMTPDLKIAKIYVSVMGTAEQKTSMLQILEHQKGEVRSFIGTKLRLKFTPSVQFYLDETLDRVEKINSLLKQIHQSDELKNSKG